MLNLRRVGPALVLGLISCGSVGKAEPSADPVSSLAEFIALECPWQSACESEGLESCYSSMLDGMVAVDLSADTLATRMACLRQARDCSDFAACEPSFFDALAGPIEDYQCPEADSEIVCDVDAGLWMWCLETADGDNPWLVRNLGDTHTCDGGRVTDVEQVPCEVSPDSDYRTCDGSVLRSCMHGLTYSWDCAQIDPSFTCAVDREDSDLGDYECLGQTQECGSNSFTNSGGSARCADSTTASICMGGKLFTVNCAEFDGATCVEDGDYEARCI